MTDRRPVVRAPGGAAVDCLAVEDPLEIRVGFGPARARGRRAVAVTLRTPGHDADLAVGYLFAERVIAAAADVLDIVAAESASIIRVDLRPGVPFDAAALARGAAMSAACGACGKLTLDQLELACDPVPDGPAVPAAVLHSLPEKLRAAQPAFAATGGIHGAALFDFDGTLLTAREDVGRHNAVDKVVGARLRGPGLRPGVLAVSGRVGFELVQKAAAAGFPVLLAVGAASTLAADAAARMNVTLIGFARDGRLTVYTRPDRVTPAASGNEELRAR